MDYQESEKKFYGTIEKTEWQISGKMIRPSRTLSLLARICGKPSSGRLKRINIYTSPRD